MTDQELAFKLDTEIRKDPKLLEVMTLASSIAAALIVVGAPSSPELSVALRVVADITAVPLDMPNDEMAEHILAIGQRHVAELPVGILVSHNLQEKAIEE